MTARRRDRIVFIGINALFSVCHATMLAESYHVVAVLETIRPLSWLKRLERRLFASRLEACARRAGATFREVPHGDNAALSLLLRELAPDLVVVAGMGWLLDREALSIPRLGTLNVHPALLPAYRGAEPIFWQLVDGVAESGVTVHQVDPCEDRGPIVRLQSFPVPPGTSLTQFLARQLAIGPPLLLAAVADTLEGRARPVAQPAASPTRRAARLHAVDASLTDWPAWGLERAWRVLSGAGSLLDCPPARWRDLGWMATVVGMSSGPHGLAGGTIGRDRQGRFLAHPQGRLHLRYRWAPRAWLLALRRRGVPASGIVASETAVRRCRRRRTARGVRRQSGARHPA